MAQAISSNADVTTTNDIPVSNILGVAVSVTHMERSIAEVERWITEKEKHYALFSPVSTIMQCRQDPKLRRVANNAGLVNPDGMPLVFLSRWRGHKTIDRVYGPDFMMAFSEMSVAKGYKHFYYGGAEGVPEELAEKMRERFPGINIVGTYSPPFRALTPEEDEEIVQMINAAEPDIVWVGLGSPKQDHWMADHVDRLNAYGLMGVGAAFDFHTGRKPQAPYWMQRRGLEWAFRLSTEPKRLWKRYLINNPLFIASSIAQQLKLREYPIER